MFCHDAGDDHAGTKEKRRIKQGFFFGTNSVEYRQKKEGQKTPRKAW